ncbi:MAG: hypothetical protein RL189_2699 [Pseudomonadota bacterium]
MLGFKTSVKLTLLSVAFGCTPRQNENSDSRVNIVIQDKKRPEKALVAVTVTPALSADSKIAMSKIENSTIMTSCGYEIELARPNGTVVTPLNKYAFDSRWGAIGGNIKYYAGSVVAITGFVAGVIIMGGSSAGGLIVPPIWYGIYPGLALVSASALAGGTLGASGDNDLKDNFESAYAFRELMSRTVYPANSHEYSARLERVKKAGNTSKPCPTLKLGELKGIAGIK